MPYTIKKIVEPSSFQAVPRESEYRRMAEMEENLDILLKIASLAKRNGYFEAFNIALEKMEAKSDMDFVVSHLMRFTIKRNPERLNKIACYRNREMMYLLLDLLRAKIPSLKTRKDKRVCKKFYRMFCSGIAKITS
ncbi:hypothetical protein BCR32DRAFT_327204 [Anaeromyces robustus]|uniref:Uncharacterized protein n=1 Tax=Anaeromyces robustus TaxID=1754192 RepID=A0A1Y1X7L7_9FUNG|nr:hypothetical protein BCR32DRAFT_327204 [Anaeromyces robustus]|eukprot:ORX81753.1 hypothetical protein BCR32DRAFT_327204 [Anaeromyces robustus]